MSVFDTFPVRLWWDGKRGGARGPGWKADLTSAPVLPGLDLRIERLDYIPFTIASITLRAEAERDMQPWELTAVRGLLAEMEARPVEVDILIDVPPPSVQELLCNCRLCMPADEHALGCDAHPAELVVHETDKRIRAKFHKAREAR